MTKKSAARVERDLQNKKTDAYLKNNTAWDELNQIGQGIGEMLHAEAGGMAEVFSIPELMVALEDPLEVASRLKALNSDVNTFSSTLEAIKKLHEGKSGSAKSTEENMRTIGIAEQYIQLEASYRATVFPNILFLSEKASEAVEKTRAKLAEQATDVNVVTDVVIKEIPVATEVAPAVENAQ